MANVEVIKKLPNLSKWEMSEMIQYSENVAKELGSARVNMTQIRKFHGHITKIWNKYLMNRPTYLKNTDKFKKEVRDEIFFVKAYLAYQAGRESKLKDLQDVLGTAIDKIQDQQDFERFKKFYDSILAYFKYYDSQRGGQKNG
ncbi:MAG TPA: type III-A CRISPR-associated protein Csm2 [Pseudothermotoga sp.]|nr:type III-A CRISPR-associated protein Csm2 [Pseudothermotoga sp.]HOK83199.1 type III-A CRISPR-associated protein Csm2 [Pseudothermotoga sp.]HPP71075.1 type III-A CRISPR-associated protein Csm2 [Pseudothermotoga sp.]